jgi:hypothetical protein
MFADKRSTEQILKFLQDTEVGNRIAEKKAEQLKKERDESYKWEELMEDSWDESGEEEEEGDDELLKWEGNGHVPKEEPKWEGGERELQEVKEFIKQTLGELHLP